jgi:hypothetical protein
MNSSLYPIRKRPLQANAPHDTAIHDIEISEGDEVGIFAIFAVAKLVDSSAWGIASFLFWKMIFWITHR